MNRSSSLLDTAQARKKAKDVLSKCLDNTAELTLVDPAILQLIMDGAPKSLQGAPPRDYLIEGQVLLPVSDRSKRLAIKKTLRRIDSMSFEQLKLFSQQPFQKE